MEEFPLGVSAPNPRSASARPGHWSAAGLWGLTPDFLTTIYSSLMAVPRNFLLIGFLLSLAPLSAQEAVPPLPSAALLQKKTEEWIRARRLIGEEAAAWKQEKATLADLNAIRKKESAQLDEFIQAAGARVDELAKQKATSADEREALRKWRSDFDAAFGKLEAQVKALAPRLPTPLRDKVEDAMLRMEENATDRPLQDRVRDTLLVLQAAREFDDSFTVTTEVRELDGRQVEVRILYLGLSQAWYVDAAGSHGGYGQPSANGWIWTEDASIAHAVRDAIAIQTGEATAAFVTLPFVPLSSSSSEK